MKHYTAGCCALLFVSLACADKGPADKNRLQGAWQAVEVEVQGRRAAAEIVKSFRVRVEGDKLTIQAGKEKREYKFALHPGKKPKGIDLTPAAGPAKGKRCPAGIYRLEGNRLRLCFDDSARAEDERPREFKTQPGRPLAMVVLKRVKK
jgi:uncharacterized protein (TIGR03067 family)